MEWIESKPFLVAILAGASAQLVKVISFLIVEKRVNYRRFVQTDGAPNMHAAAFTALSLAIGLTDGFSSIGFALSICVTSIVVVDTMNVKKATSRQAEAVLLLLDRIRKRTHEPPNGGKSVSYTPMDVATGLAMGTVVALIFG